MINMEENEFTRGDFWINLLFRFIIKLGTEYCAFNFTRYFVIFD